MTISPPLSEQAQALVEASLELARARSSVAWSPLDVLAAIADREDGRKDGLLAELQVDVPAMRRRLERAVIETIWDDDPAEKLLPPASDAYIRPSRLQPGPVFNPENDLSLYRQWRAIVFSVTKFEG